MTKGNAAVEDTEPDIPQVLREKRERTAFTPTPESGWAIQRLFELQERRIDMIEKAIAETNRVAALLGARTEAFAQEIVDIKLAMKDLNNKLPERWQTNAVHAVACATLAMILVVAWLRLVP